MSMSGEREVFYFPLLTFTSLENSAPNMNHSPRAHKDIHHLLFDLYSMHVCICIQYKKVIHTHVSNSMNPPNNNLWQDKDEKGPPLVFCLALERGRDYVIVLLTIINNLYDFPYT